MNYSKPKQSFAKRVALKPALQNTKNQYPQIAVSSQSKIELINTEEIVYLKSDGNYTKIHLVDGRTITAASTLKKYEDKLKSPTFMRVHNSYIIHRVHLKTYQHNEQKIILKNNTKIPVSRSRKEELIRYLKMLMVSMIFFLCINPIKAKSAQLFSSSLNAYFDTAFNSFEISSNMFHSPNVKS